MSESWKLEMKLDDAERLSLCKSEKEAQAIVLHELHIIHCDNKDWVEPAPEEFNHDEVLAWVDRHKIDFNFCITNSIAYQT